MSEVTAQALTAGERAEQVLVGLLERAVQGVDAAVEFSQAEIPEVITQLLVWHFAENFISFVVALLLYAFSIWYVVWIFKQRPEAIGEEKDHWGDPVTRYKRSFWFDRDGDSTGAHAIALAAVIPIMLASIVMNITWLKIWVAPKLYLLEYGASLLK